MSLTFKYKGAKYNKNEQLNYERPPIPNVVASTILNALPKKTITKILKTFMISFTKFILTIFHIGDLDNS